MRSCGLCPSPLPSSAVQTVWGTPLPGGPEPTRCPQPVSAGPLSPWLPPLVPQTYLCLAGVTPSLHPRLYSFHNAPRPSALPPFPMSPLLVPILFLLSLSSMPATEPLMFYGESVISDTHETGLLLRRSPGLGGKTERQPLTAKPRAPWRLDQHSALRVVSDNQRARSGRGEAAL